MMKTSVRNLLVYIAGPYRGDNAWEVELNVRRAEEASLEVWRRGAVALCPHTNARSFGGTLPDSVWLEGDLHLLRRCDAMLLVGKWWRSSGTIGEIRHAEIHDIPVFDSLVDLEKWIQGPHIERKFVSPPPLTLSYAWRVVSEKQDKLTKMLLYGGATP